MSPLCRAAQAFSVRVKLGVMLWLVAGAAVAGEQGLRWEIWRDVPGYQLRDFTESVKFNRAPDAVRTVGSADVAIDQTDFYGARVRAMLTVPVAGEYEFWIASDDGSELYLAENGSKFAKRKVAQVSSYVTRHQWDVLPEQHSGKIALQAG